MNKRLDDIDSAIAHLYDRDQQVHDKITEMMKEFIIEDKKSMIAVAMVAESLKNLNKRVGDIEKGL